MSALQLELHPVEKHLRPIDRGLFRDLVTMAGRFCCAGDEAAIAALEIIADKWIGVASNASREAVYGSNRGRDAEVSREYYDLAERYRRLAVMVLDGKFSADTGETS